eukprot:5006626-Lingulodinium_polyedra.AAC.1
MCIRDRGSICSSAIGPHQVEPENASGGHLRRFCEAFGLQAPQTHAHLMSGQQNFTWLSKR